MGTGIEYESHLVDVTVASDVLLKEMAEAYRQSIADPEQGPAAQRWYQEVLDIIEEEIEARGEESPCAESGAATAP